MEDDAYLTVEGESEGIYKEKGSRFLGFARPVETERQVRDYMEDLKKKYHDARHHCYAFIIGTGSQAYFRANDAGEPNHSAGVPILGQIRSKGLTNTMVAVVRYFGGTKLGVPGLVNAYKTAAADALANARIVEKTVRQKLALRFSYDQMNEAMRLVKEFDMEIFDQEFQMDCRMTVGVRKSRANEAQEKLARVNIEANPVE